MSNSKFRSAAGNASQCVSVSFAALLSMLQSVASAHLDTNMTESSSTGNSSTATSPPTLGDAMAIGSGSSSVTKVTRIEPPDKKKKRKANEIPSLPIAAIETKPITAATAAAAKPNAGTTTVLKSAVAECRKYSSIFLSELLKVIYLYIIYSSFSVV